MTDDELKGLVASLAVSQKETGRKLDKVAKMTLGGISANQGDVVEDFFIIV